MAAQDYTAVVQQLYVSYFGRPADYFGLQNFSAQLDAMGAPKTFAELQAAVGADVAGTSALSQLVNSFNNSAESVALYGNDNSQIGVSKFVAAIYQNVLGREADTAGFNFWVQAISSGTLSKANAAAAITAAASTNTSAQGVLDAQTVANKLGVATAFTAALDTPTELTAYSGDAAAATGRSLLQGVNNTTDMDAYQENIDDAINSIVNVSNPGETKSLTVGVDTLTGGNGDDVFNAIPQGADGKGAETLGAFDVIDGGAGKDTLNIYTAAGFNVTAQGTVKNVETINIYNQDVIFSAAGVDASKFVGATTINQAGKFAAVTNLSASTTAAFTGASTATTALDVTAADAASSVKVALNDVTGTTVAVPATAGSPAVDPVLDADGNVVTPGKDAVAPTPGVPVNQATLNVSGASLSSVTVSGNIAKAVTTSSTAGSLLLNVEAGASSTGASISSVSVNTAVKTTLTVTEGSDTKTGNVTSVDASASTGGITFNAANTVSTIATGTGADTVTINFATAAAVGSTAAKNASVSTGAGKDVINVLTTGNGLTTVDAGAGDDTINVTKSADARLNISAGEGNDTVAISGAALSTNDVIDGGAGIDTISVAGKATRTADDFIVFNKLVKNFETIKFTGATAEGALDASLLGANYTTIDLNTGSVVKNVGTQSIVANGGLTVTATGYTAAEGTTKAVYGGTLNITEKATGTVTANADVVKLTVAAGTTGDVTGTLAGDAKSAIVTLTNALNAAGDTDTIAKFSLTTAESATGNAALTSVTLSGNGSASITNADKTALVNVDASALGGKLTVGADAGDAIVGLTYVSDNTAVETIKLGAGIDSVTLNASNYGAVDTVTGLNLVLAADGKSLDATSDKLIIDGINGAVKFTTTQTDFDLALKDAATYQVNGADANTVVFSFGGDTYVYQDVGTGNTVGADDVVVKLTGAINLDALVVALGGTPA